VNETRTSGREALRNARQRLRGTVASSEVGRRLWSWWSHRKTEVYFLSYPKAGRTWLRLLVGKALIDELALAGASPMELSDLHRHSDVIPRMRVTHDDDPQLKRPEEVERDKSRYAGKSVVFLVRNPRDVVISYYFQASKRRDRFAGTPSEFLRHPVGALDTIIAYYNAWADQRSAPERFCLVRYEDLHRDAAGQLERVLATFGRAPRREVVDGAVEYARFDNMRALEKKNAFGSARLRPGDEADPESFKTRKGKVGGYREYLTPDDIAWMNARIRERLSPFYPEYIEG
jgi:hypothetical protein